MHDGYERVCRVAHELILRVHACVGRMEAWMVRVRVLSPSGLLVHHARRGGHRVLTVTGDERTTLSVGRAGLLVEALLLVVLLLLGVLEE